MESLKRFFAYMNDVTFPYVVLRNWEGLPHSVQLGEHSDLDLLVYDISHWQEIFPEAVREHPAPRVRFKIPIGDSFIYADIRHIGDRYYPEHFERSMLQTREWNTAGFFTPDHIHFITGLAYHCVHHKGRNTYPEHLGDLSVEQLLDSLKKSPVGWVEPKDPTVGRFNQYFKGATAVVDKKGDKVLKSQVSYLDYDLLGNEYRILSRCNSRHFPKCSKASETGIMLDDCGDPLSHANLPQDWKHQLIEIMDDLKKRNVQHRDIRPDNLMVKDGVIKLIDFGWARFYDDPPDDPPACLGRPYAPSAGWDDNYSMRQVMRKIEFDLEEAHADIRV